MHPSRKTLSALLAAAMLLLLFPVTAMADPVTVNLTQEYLDGGTGRYTITGTGTDPVIINVQENVVLRSTLTINGNGKDVTIHGNGYTLQAVSNQNIRLMSVVCTGNTATISDLTFTGARSSFIGGALMVNGNLVATGCTFTDNQAGGGGGGAVNATSATLNNCTFTNNRTTGSSYSGGAILANEIASMTNCVFIDNSATYRGGAVNIVDGNRTMTIQGCEFYGNTAENNGGAICFSQSGHTLTATSSNYFDGNGKPDGTPNGSAPGIDAKYGIYLFLSSGTITNSENLLLERGPNYPSPPAQPGDPGDPVLPMPLPADFVVRLPGAQMLLYPAYGSPVVRDLGYYYTVQVTSLAENGFAAVTYRGQSGYVPLSQLGRSEGLTW